MAIILMDVDGPCSNFVESLLVEMEGVPDLPVRDAITTWDFFKKIFNKHQKEIAYKILEDPEFWGSMSVTPGSREGIELLRKEGHEIVFVTAPWEKCEGWGEARKKWLKKHFKADYNDVVICSRKGLINGDIFIDDKLSNLNEWQEANPSKPSWLYSCPHNQSEKWPLRFTWSYESAKIVGNKAVQIVDTL